MRGVAFAAPLFFLNARQVPQQYRVRLHLQVTLRYYISIAWDIIASFNYRDCTSFAKASAGENVFSWCRLPGA
jgi:hypothetical protein